jgi:hypothetical protein
LWPEYVSRDLPLNRPERKAVHREAWKLWAANRWNIVLYLAVPAIYLCAVFFAADFGGRVAGMFGVTGPGYRLFRAGAPVVLFVACFAGGGAVLQRFRFAPCAYRATRRHGHEVCVRCGYWLKGLGEEIDRCPECGARREPMPQSRQEDQEQGGA